MDRFRRTIEDLSASQRATLGFLVVLVLMTATIAIVVAAAGVDADGDPASSTPPTAAGSDPTTTPTPVTSSTPVTTTTLGTTTSTASTTTTTTAAPPERELIMRPDGLGDLYFGDDADEVLAGLVGVLGEPDEDTGWVDQAENYGICFGENVRFVRWGSLQAFFSDGPTSWRPAGVRHFASYTQATFFEGDRLDLVTADGLALGSPVGDIRAIYGDEAVVDDPLFGPIFAYDPPGNAYQWGSVSGLAADDQIETINGSFACGE